MGNEYTQIRRQWRDVDPERDLKALWAAERFESSERARDALRITELAIRVAGWDQVKTWAREQLAVNAILNAQLVELAMRALERKDDAFLIELGSTLRERSPGSYFRFWHTLFTARHSHRGERIFKDELSRIPDYQLVKYRRWVRRIFRKLRFRCETPREKAIGAIAFAMLSHFKSSAYESDVFAAYVAAAKAASTWEKTKAEKPVSGEKQAELFSVHAAKLGIWTIAEGLRTSAKIPRTLTYLQAMAPRMTDIEVLRALRAFDAHLGTADHKKASEQVVAVAAYLRERLSKIDVPLDEWGKILPYVVSPVLKRVLEELVGGRLDAAISSLAGKLPFAPIAMIDLLSDARAVRAGFLSSYAVFSAHAEASLMVIDSARTVSVMSPLSRYWPYGVGLEPTGKRWEEEPDHPHRPAFGVIASIFPSTAKQAKSSQQSMDPVLRALRWRLWRRQTIDGGVSALDVPIIFLPQAPVDEEKKALSIMLDAFAAAVLVRFEERWDAPLDRAHIVHLTLPRAVLPAIEELVRAFPAIEAARATFAARRAKIDRDTRLLLLGAQPIVRHITK